MIDLICDVKVGTHSTFYSKDKNSALVVCSRHRQQYNERDEFGPLCDWEEIDLKYVDLRVVKKLKSGDWQFGCAGKHRGSGSEDCPRHPHHHHDEFCNRPTVHELNSAGINSRDFKPTSRR